MLEQSSPAVATMQVEVATGKEENNSPNSEPASDSEGHELSDDDEDDDRNHKHRRREPRLQPVGTSSLEQSMNNPNRKRVRPFEKGKNSSAADFQSASSTAAEKRRHGMMQHTRNSLEPFPRNRMNPSSRPPGPTGRGKNTGPWNRHDARFNPHNRMDFAPHMASQGPPTHPGLFMGTGLPNGGPAQTGTWGSYGFIPGIGNGLLDPIHPLGPLPPAMNPLLDLGLPRQRCRDFEELGYCLRGDMCPMEHGVNRIVIDDMQSLSQFNLPVSLPNQHIMGIQSEQLIEPAAVASSLLVGNKSACTNETKPAITNDVQRASGLSAQTIVDDADVYDPDQPLWNNQQAETGIGLPIPGEDSKQLWNAESSVNGSLHDHLNLKSKDATVPQSSKSFRAHGHSKRKFGMRKTSSGYNPEIQKNGLEGLSGAAKDGVAKDDAMIISGVPSSSRTLGNRQRASRTLYVSGIPVEQNRWDTLLAHFEKFGEVIDIYVPANSERAFIQFSKREEAEAALKAPDAVMGNRFIRLWWANRDRIPVEGEPTTLPKPFLSKGASASSDTSEASALSRGTANLLPPPPKLTTAPSVEKAAPSGFSKPLPLNGVKAAQPDPKKLENLELLEEIRKKQEALAQKRDEFRRQLEKLAKQAGSTKKASGDEKEVKGVTSNSNDTKNSGSAENLNPDTSFEAGKKSDLGDTELMPSAKAATAPEQKFHAVTIPANPLAASVQNRFKLDNRTTAFRILPPLPSEIAEVSILKDHFSSFGEVVSVVLEDTESRNQDLNLKPSTDCSACVTYKTRQSAEKAFLSGKSCNGHTLRFMWLTAPPNSNGHYSHQSSSQPFKSTAVVPEIEQLITQSPLVATEVIPSSSSFGEANRGGKSLASGEESNDPPVSCSMDNQTLPSSVLSQEECQQSCNSANDADEVNDEHAQ